MININENLLNKQTILSLMNSMTDAVMALSEDLVIELYNSATLNLLDINNIADNSLIYDIFKPIDSKEQSLDLVNFIKNIKVPTTNRDYLLQYSDKSKINIFISISPIRLNYRQSGLQGYVIIIRDITREKSLEEERDEFISVVSHELRTPIAITEGAISNSIAMASKFSIPDQITKSMEQAHQQTLFLADTINDLATLSRAERGVLEVKLDEINVKNLLNELLLAYSSSARKKGLRIKIDFNEKDDFNIFSTTLYLKEILQNFITNAIKYSNEGMIVLKAVKSDRGVMFYITDNGIGISKSDQSKVFDKFFRSEDFRTRQANGTGLGLYVTAKLARIISAKISLTSKLNVGSTFIIDVPDLSNK